VYGGNIEVIAINEIYEVSVSVLYIWVPYHSHIDC
jgi:hypothetical protein